MKTIRFSIALLCAAVLASCGMQKQLSKQARITLLDNPDFAPAHVGIALYDPATKQFIYDHDGDKFFVPASNTKLFTCYAAMTHLSDSLAGLLYTDNGNGAVTIEGNADASFLMPDFKQHPVLAFLRQQKKIVFTDANWKDNGLGMGWAWDDYNSDYMNERSALPMYGNLARFSNSKGFSAMPSQFGKQLDKDVIAKGNFTIRRNYGSNTFTARASNSKFTSAEIPFSTAGSEVLVQLLRDTLPGEVVLSHEPMPASATVKKIYSQPTDSLLKIMMHRSDNFFAEQTLLMISNEKLGMMNDARIIDTLLKTDFAGLPQKPKWVDGSGLSRYNLISPKDFVWVLAQMKDRFDWKRITAILPTGGEGTLSSSYKDYAGRIYAKTGTLSNHVALSGYILTKKGKQLIFSVLVNAHMTSATNIRKAVERFLTGVMDKY